MKMSSYTKKYISEFLLTKEDKMNLLDCFRRKKNVKQKIMKNYLNVFEYERSRKVYDTKYPELLEEIRYIPIGTIEFWEMLSSKCQQYINNYFYEKYKVESNFKFSYYRDYEHCGETEYYQRKIDYIYSFAIKNDLSCVDKKGFIDPTYIEEVINANRLINDDLVKLEVIVYALQEFDLSLIDFDCYDNLVLTEKAIDLYIHQKNIIPLTLQERIRKSVSASYQTFKSYAQCNADKFKYFITLTFADINEKEKHFKLNEDRKEGEVDLKFKYVQNAQDYEECVKKMTSFLNKMKKYLQRKGNELYYLGVPEYQSNGNIHYHFLFSDFPKEYLYNVPDWLDRDYTTNKIVGGKGIKLWEYGKSDVSIINYKNRITTYISKYMLKSISNISSTQYLYRLNKKRFYNSNNLEKPIVKYDSFDENNIDFVCKYESINSDKYDGTYIRSRLYQLVDI